MATNAGYKLEERIAQEISSSGKACFKKLDGSLAEFPVSDRVLTGGKTTRNKWDILVNPAVRLQVKSSSSKRSAVVNMVPVRNLLKLASREMIDVQPAITVMDLLVKTGKAVKLAEIDSVDNWHDLLSYLLFEGTPTAQEVPALQANYLLSVDGADYVIIEKNQAIPHIWNSLTAELRTRKGKDEPCLHIRYGR